MSARSKPSPTATWAFWDRGLPNCSQASSAVSRRCSRCLTASRSAKGSPPRLSHRCGTSIGCSRNATPMHRPPTGSSSSDTASLAFSWPSAALTQLEQKTFKGGRDADTDEMKSLAHYDSATHDAFPLFKGNFQPLSETLDRLAVWFPNSKPSEATVFPDKSICGQWKTFAAPCQSAIVHTLRFTAGLVRNIPFTKPVSDDTLTIGHLDPMRPPYDGYANPVWQSPLPFGTTSELVINNGIGHPTLYKYAGAAYFSECAVVDHWLWKARHNASLAPFEGWDSGYSHIRNHKVVPDKDTPNATPIRPRPTDNGHLEIQSLHYLFTIGTHSIITSIA